jgi:hypothetical protein
VDVTTHLRAWAAQAGALLALVVGGVAAAPAVALAAPPGVQITNLSPTDVLAGGQVQLQYTVANNSGAGGGGGGGGGNGANIKVTGMSCNGDCSQVTQIDPGGNKQFNAKLTAPQVAAGATQTVTVTISVTIGNDQNTAQQQVTVRGPDKPQTVTAITGKVKDADGKSISGAAVGARDSAGSTFSATTNGSGSFSINSSDSHPIAPGSITVAAGKSGYENANVEVTGVAGRTVNVPLTLKLTAATTSASPSASASDVPSAPAAALDTNVPSQLAVLPSDDTATKKASQNSSSGSMLFIVLGGLLVAAGIGAIVLVLMRRRNAGGNGGDEGNDPTAMGGGPGVVPPSQGRFNDATRVASPVGAGPATMVAPRSGAPSMADAPTMLQRPVPAVEDEFPDPYGAPLPPGGGYNGTQAGGWDNQAAAGAYGAPTQYGPAQDDYADPQYGADSQYGAAQAGYGGGQYGAAAGAPAAGGSPERFDEHTSLYRPESDQDGYGDYGQGGYGAGADAGQYGGAGQAGGAYGGGAAGAGQYGGGTYGGGAAAGGQYGGGAYGGRADEDYRPGGAYQGGGYGQEPADQGGYGSPAGGIDSGNGYGPQPGGQGGNVAGGSQYGGGTYGGGAAAAGGTYGGGQPQYGGGYDEHAGYEQGYDQPGGAAYGDGAEYGSGATGQAPQQYGGGYDQYDEQNNGGYAGGRRGTGAYDDQQPSRRGAARRPNDY